MGLIYIDGFKVYDDLQGKPNQIIIEPHLIDEGMQFAQKHNLWGVVIAPPHGYDIDNVDFLKRYSFIKHLHIQDPSNMIKNIEGIYALKNLSSLHISGERRKIDFAMFTDLKKLILHWSTQIINIDKCIQLESLTLIKYNPLVKDLTLLSNMTWLKSLDITQSTIDSLKGLGNFAELKTLEISYCSKLEQICCMDNSKETLTNLFFNNCKRIRNHDYVTRFKNLKILAFSYCGNIDSIKFINKISSLESFRFMDTNIIDGDISPCIGLKYAGFSNKKHYNYTFDEIEILNKNHISHKS